MPSIHSDRDTCLLSKSDGALACLPHGFAVHSSCAHDETARRALRVLLEDLNMRFCIMASLLATSLFAGFATAQEKAREKEVHDEMLELSQNDHFLFFVLGGASRTGKILDVFNGDRVLVSFGAQCGAGKGLKLEVYRLNPKSVYVGRVEFVEVGAMHAVGRFRGPERVRENDLVSLFFPKNDLDSLFSPVRPMAPWPQQWDRPPGWNGGAIIDLTQPAKSK
jgi:hypothetical protein